MKNRTVDNIPYLCCVADTGEHYGITSKKYDDWLKNKKEVYMMSDELSFEEWLVKKHIPLVIKKVRTDIDLFSLPKVFQYNNGLDVKKFQRQISQLAMTISINFEHKIILVL